MMHGFMHADIFCVHMPLSHPTLAAM